MSKKTILHLVDDLTPGGVMRVVETFVESEFLNADMTHEMVVFPSRHADRSLANSDGVVSHITLNWKNFSARAQLRANHPNLPLIHYEHSYTSGLVAQIVDDTDRLFAMLRSGYALFDQVVSVSYAQARWIRRENLVNKAMLNTVQSSVNLEPFLALSAIVGAPKTFGLMGRLKPEKGFDIVVQAFKTCDDPDLRLNVYGEGPEKEKLVSLAKPDARICFHGHTNNPTAAMQTIDALLVPSRWETFGLVVSEAMAAGRSAYVVPVDGLADHIRQGAIAVQDHDVATWAQTIRLAASEPVPLSRLRRSLIDKRPDTASEFEQAWISLLRLLRAAPVSGLVC